MVDDTKASLRSSILYQDLLQGTSGDSCLFLEGTKDADHGSALNKRCIDAFGLGHAE